MAPVTIIQLATYRGAVGDEHGRIHGGEFNRVGLEIMGGCEICGATLAAYNACPSKPGRTGKWRCRDGCIGDDGWDDIVDADKEIFGRDQTELSRAVSWLEDLTADGLVDADTAAAIRAVTAAVRGRRHERSVVE